MTECNHEIGYCITHNRPLEICTFDVKFTKTELQYIRFKIKDPKGINIREMEILDKIAIKLGEKTIDEVLEGREY